MGTTDAWWITLLMKYCLASSHLITPVREAYFNNYNCRNRGASANPTFFQFWNVNSLSRYISPRLPAHPLAEKQRREPCSGIPLLSDQPRDYRSMQTIILHKSPWLLLISFTTWFLPVIGLLWSSWRRVQFQFTLRAPRRSGNLGNFSKIHSTF